MNENNGNNIVISVSFSGRSSNEDKEKKTDEQLGKVLPFIKPNKRRSSAARETTDAMTALAAPKHSLYLYLRMLMGKKLISQTEFDRVIMAVQPLMQLFPQVDDEIIRGVRAEFSGNDKPVKDEIAEQEERLWRNAAGRSLIPGFDLEESRKHFTMPNARVHFLRSEFARPVKEPDVPYELLQGEQFFFILVRMFRRQYEKNIAEEARKQQPDQPVKTTARLSPQSYLFSADPSIPRAKN